MRFRLLASQEALWRIAGGDTPGPARSVPIIRIENGTHMLPFKKDGSPTAYLKSPIENDQILLVRKLIPPMSDRGNFWRNSASAAST